MNQENRQEEIKEAVREVAQIRIQLINIGLSAKTPETWQIAAQIHRTIILKQQVPQREK